MESNTCLPHRACPVCGTYHGRTVFRVEEERHRLT